MSGLSSSFLSLLFVEEEHIDVRLDSSSLDGGIDEELVELVILSDGLLDVLRSDSLSFLFLAEVSCDLHDFSNNVLNTGG